MNLRCACIFSYELYFKLKVSLHQCQLSILRSQLKGEGDLVPVSTVVMTLLFIQDHSYSDSTVHLSSTQSDMAVIHQGETPITIYY